MESASATTGKCTVLPPQHVEVFDADTPPNPDDKLGEAEIRVWDLFRHDGTKELQLKMDGETDLYVTLGEEQWTQLSKDRRRANSFIAHNYSHHKYKELFSQISVQLGRLPGGDCQPIKHTNQKLVLLIERVLLIVPLRRLLLGSSHFGRLSPRRWFLSRCLGRRTFLDQPGNPRGFVVDCPIAHFYVASIEFRLRED